MDLCESCLDHDECPWVVCIFTNPPDEVVTLDEVYPDCHFTTWCSICQEVDCSNPDH